MTEGILEKISIPDLAVGIGIGFLLGYIVAKKTLTLETSSIGQLSSLNIGIKQLGERLRIIETMLNIPSPIQIPLSGSPLSGSPLSDSPLSDSPLSDSPPFKSPNMKLVMENEEDFDFRKDEKGKITGLTTHRKLFENRID